MVQWLELHVFTVEGLGSIPCQGTKTSHTETREKKKEKRNFKKKKTVLQRVQYGGVMLKQGDPELTVSHQNTEVGSPSLLQGIFPT